MQTYTPTRQLRKVIFVSDEPENNKYEVDSNQFSKELMDYFYLVLSKNNKEVAVSKNYNRLNSKLSEYSDYSDDWDDEGSPSIDKNAVDNLSAFLEVCDDVLLNGWSLFPTQHGTLALEKHKDGVNAVFDVGATLMSYSVANPNMKLVGKEPFSSNTIVNILGKLK